MTNDSGVMTVQISSEAMVQYKRTARLRWEREQAHREVRRAQAWRLAHQAADLLRRDFEVDRVAIFGSLIHPGRFWSHSDVDLAAWGLTARNWLKARAAVRYLSAEIELNLVDVDCCSPELLAIIESEGVPV